MSDTNWGFSQTFLVEFQSIRSDIQTRIDALKPSDGTTTQQSFHDLTIDLAKLGKRLGDATGSLPSYDQRQCELQIKSLEKELDTLRTNSAPKSKFAFKKKAVSSTATLAVPVSPPTLETTAAIPSQLPASSSHLSLCHQSESYLGWSLIPAASDEHRDLTIFDLRHCIVNLLRSDVLQNSESGDGKETKISAIHINDVSNSLLLLPKIPGSVLLHNLQNSIVVIGCHQFRMHTSHNVDVYIEIPSNPIIEHCTGIRFAPYPATISQNPSKMSTLAVQDFSHIRATPSPNWTTLKESDSVASWPIQTITDSPAIVEILERLCRK